jgi:triosephosphate isomerase
MNTTKSAAVALAKGVAAGVSDDKVRVGVAPPFVYLDAVGQALAGSKVLLGAQDLYFQKNGAFTGEISAEMLLDLGVKFCLAGHSERRHVIGETGDIVSKKANAIYNAGLILVHCVGEKLEERQANQTLEVVRRQLNELSSAINDPTRLVIAYEPVWAIGTGINATSDQAQEVHAFIRAELQHIYGINFAQQVVIQYGGSMKPDNAKELLDQNDVDGGLIGGAALKPETFLPIVNAART